ncbi:MAG: hypothetical protein Q8P42_05410 [Gallionella sp.]|nr:hypothetical protein [Gallionella sp.]
MKFFDEELDKLQMGSNAGTTSRNTQRSNEMTATVPTLDESIEAMKKEIIEDVKSGRVPADCPSFSALHDYVDANCYGGFCEDDVMQALLEHYGGRDENEGMPDELMDYFNEAQNSIDRWIKEGGIKQVASPTPWRG